MSERKYAVTPQNDLKQLEQILLEYEADPSKGLAHGIQKDAIQNSFGAREYEKEKTACKNWKTTFELVEIKGKEALVFWDEGTVGLTGEILDVDEIDKRSALGHLGPEERLGRFLTRFESGENIGAGMFGRGKLIFNCASEQWKIIVDSVRYDDNKYIAFERFIDNTRLKQNHIPLIGQEAKEFIISESDGILEPLSKPGTRITIINVRSEVSCPFKKVFEENSNELYGYRESFSKMIEETWWEIIQKFDAEIVLKYKDMEYKVQLNDPLNKLLNAKDKSEKFRVYERKQININIGTDRYTIKELKFIVAPTNVDEDLRDFWVQRKRMKIGSILRNIHPHHLIARKFCGYVILDKKLENVVEKAEGVTHYGFVLNKIGVKHIRDVLRAELKFFEQQLGLKSISKDDSSRKELSDAMKEINYNAKDLGLPTDHGKGLKTKDIQILLEEINLPYPNTSQVEMGDQIGPIKYLLKNNTGVTKNVKMSVITKQAGLRENNLYTCDTILQAQEEKLVIVDSFTVSEDSFEPYRAFNILAEVTNLDTGHIFDKNLQKIWIGIAPPENPKKVRLSISCKFPRRDTRRVESSEIIEDIKVKIKNETAANLKVSLDLSVRQCENKEIGRQAIPLFNLIKDKELEIKPLAEIIIKDIDDIYVTNEYFRSILESDVNILERKCDIFGKLRLEEACEELNLGKYEKLDKCSLEFYVDVDPPGHSIFNKTELIEAPDDNRRSWYEGNVYIGFTFCLNIKHPFHLEVKDHAISELDKLILKEQILTQAYYVSADLDNFSGPAEVFAKELQDETLSNTQASKYFDEILGAALKHIIER